MKDLAEKTSSDKLPNEFFSVSSLDINLEEHFILPVSLKNSSDSVIETFALIDSGATANFINESFVSENGFSVSSLEIPRKLKVVDGRSISSGDVKNSVSSDMSIGLNHKEKITLYVAQIGRFPLILGIPWLKIHAPQICWDSRKINFVSSYCVKNCSIQNNSVSSVPEYFLASLSKPLSTFKEKSVESETAFVKDK